MHNKLTPIGDRLVVHPVVEKPAQPGLIIIPDVAKPHSSQVAIVVATGAKVNACKVGDKVYLPQCGGTEVQYEGKTYVILREQEILGIFDAPEGK